MLVGAYPFEDPADPKNFRKTIVKILGVQYSIPDHIHISIECRHLLSRIFVANPEERIAIPEIRRHPWFLKNLPVELMDGGSYQCMDVNNPSQSMEEISLIIKEARIVVQLPRTRTYSFGGSMELDDLDDIEDIETSGDFVSQL